MFDPGTGSVTDLASAISAPVDIKDGPDGALYYLARGDGSVYWIVSTVTPSLSPSPLVKPGDLDGDNDVDIFDYNQLLTDFGKTGNLAADIDKNGKVDIFDYNILLTNFGK